MGEGENIGPITPAANQAAATVVQKSDNDFFCPILILVKLNSVKHNLSIIYKLFSMFFKNGWGGKKLLKVKQERICPFWILVR